jgi:hypothetical protein
MFLELDIYVKNIIFCIYPFTVAHQENILRVELPHNGRLNGNLGQSQTLSQIFLEIAPELSISADFATPVLSDTQKQFAFRGYSAERFAPL